MLNFFIAMVITSALAYSQNNPKKYNFFKPDTSKTRTAPFHYLTPDSLGWEKLPQPDVYKYFKDGFKYFPQEKWDQSSERILVYRPDSDVIYNMPEYVPDSTINYTMPKAPFGKDSQILKQNKK